LFHLIVESSFLVCTPSTEKLCGFVFEELARTTKVIPLCAHRFKDIPPGVTWLTDVQKWHRYS
jgi:hypothetical protein